MKQMVTVVWRRGDITTESVHLGVQTVDIVKGSLVLRFDNETIAYAPGVWLRSTTVVTEGGE